jgi:MoaA/NifB/PqqE/SkfB family radical SAM enzyme
VTRRCNANCPFCFYLRSGNAPVAPQPELSFAEIEKVSASLGNLLWLAFSGGEIFLRNDLAEIAGVFYRNNRPAIMLFPTNGLLPELIRDRMETILRSCPQSVIALKLSLDNVGKAHDELRRTPGSFAKTLRAHELVAGLVDQYPNFELGVNTVFCADNQKDMDRIIEYVRGMRNIKTHTISLIRGDLADRHFSDVDTALYQEAVRKLERNLKEGRSPVYRFRGGRIKAAQDILQRRLIHRTMTEQKWIMPCYAGRLNLVLGETGGVFPCELLAESFGNVRDFNCDIGKVMRSEPARKAVRAIRDDKCFCTHECYFMTNILFNPLLYPALLKDYLQLRPG